MKMSKKTLIGLLILLAGVVLFIVAKNRRDDRRTSVSLPGITIEGRSDEDEKDSRLGEILGIVAIVGGAAVLFVNRKK